ncbi:MAG TPA: heme-copper oxidase subunit III [Methylomirabilota bacterium]|jgi:heme/copper-type cytochrome/quinol oxidase subunit 3
MVTRPLRVVLAAAGVGASSLAVQAPPAPPGSRRRNGRVPPALPRTGGGDGNGEPTPRPPILDNLRLAVLVFIGAETMFFAALISALFVLRLGIAAWPPPLEPRLPVALTGVNTLVLLASSVAMVRAVRALSRDDRRGLVRGLVVAAALGATFLAVQGYEWVRLLRFGLHISSGSYGTTFYTLIGSHALHVVAALVWLVGTTTAAAAGRFSAHRSTAVRACAMYWHFVVALWPILYVTVYLL